MLDVIANAPNETIIPKITKTIDVVVKPLTDLTTLFCPCSLSFLDMILATIERTKIETHNTKRIILNILKVFICSGVTLISPIISLKNWNDNLSGQNPSCFNKYIPKIRMMEASIKMNKITKAIHGMIKAAINCKTTSLNATRSRMTASTIDEKVIIKAMTAILLAEDLYFSLSISISSIS